jgi:hypothetical protein
MISFYFVREIEAFTLILSGYNCINTIGVLCALLPFAMSLLEFKKSPCPTAMQTNYILKALTVLLCQLQKHLRSMIGICEKFPHRSLSMGCLFF